MANYGYVIDGVPCMIDNIQQICTTDGQSYQIFMPELNNVNGTQYFTCSPHQNSDTTVLHQQQIIVEGQLQQGSLDQSQNVYIINTDGNLSREEYKTEYLEEIQTNEVISESEENLKEPISGFINGQQIQLIRIPENNINNQSATMKQLPRVPLKNDDQGTSDKKYRLVSKHNKYGINHNNIAPTSFRLKALDPSSASKSPTQTMKSQTQPVKSSIPSGKTSKPPTPSARVPIHQNTPRQANTVALESLSERLKQDKMKSSGQNQSLLNNSMQKNIKKQQQQKQQQQQIQKNQLLIQKQQQQKSKSVQSVYINKSSPEKNEQFINIDKSDNESPPISPEKSVNSDSSINEVDTMNNTESYAYLQKAIDNPQTTIVQHQIEGNTVKMLVVMPNSEQRLITFDIPTEECTVNDLLEQAGIPFNGSTTVSLVKDPILKINYIVESEAGTIVDSTETGDSTDELLADNNILIDRNYLQDYCDDNLQTSSTINIEKPKYINGKLAMCSNCGLSSMDFNRCYRCKRKIQNNPKTMPYECTQQQSKDMMLSIDKYYENILSNNEYRQISNNSIVKQRGRVKTIKSKLIKEPECLTLSSDDEDTNDSDKKPKKIDINKKINTSKDHLMNDEYDIITEKEPIITNSIMSNDINKNELSNDLHQHQHQQQQQQPQQQQQQQHQQQQQQQQNELTNIEDGTILKPHTTLICRTVRIGSYKFIPKDHIVINSSGLTLSVPLLEDENEYCKIHIRYQDIVKVLIHFGKSMPVLFFYTNTISGSKVRDFLGMQDIKGPYYDPASKDHTHKRITLLPEKLTEESKLIIKHLFVSKNLLEELNTKEANDILIRASPKDPNNVVCKRQSIGTNLNQSNGIVENMTVYPPPPAKGGITITTDDYSCLGEDQFLNDVIIDFYLKYATLELLSKSDQQRTHVFSTYFYKRLTSPHAQTGDSKKLLTPAAKRHARVSKWTKNVNIFDKDFIIIPINEHSHWFLAIICFPGLVGIVKPEVTLPTATTTTTTTTNQKDDKLINLKNKKLKEHKLQSVTIGSTTITPVTTTITLDQQEDGSERDEAEGDDDELDIDSEDEEDDENNIIQKKNNNDNNKINNKIIKEEENNINIKEEDIKIPCILIFDSLNNIGRSRVVATLRDYLSCEYSAKIGCEKLFTKDTIKGACPKIPQQSNFTDCGLYVLQYVESFFKDPIMNYTLPIKTLKNWFDEIIVTRKREDISKLLVRLMKKTNGDKNINVPILQFPTIDGILKLRPEKIEEKKEDGKRKDDENSKIVGQIIDQLEPGEIIPTNATVYTIVPCSINSDGNAMEIDVKLKNMSTPGGNLSFLRTKRVPKINSLDPSDNNGPVKKFKSETT